MCGVPGVALTEAEVRQRASTFAYQRLVDRHETVLGPDWKPLALQSIDPGSWHVSRTDTGWRLTRHLTRDLWQAVECELDGSRAFDGMDVGPGPVPPASPTGGLEAGQAATRG
jgi:hypothetical protein